MSNLLRGLNLQYLTEIDAPKTAPAWMSGYSTWGKVKGGARRPRRGWGQASSKMAFSKGRRSLS